MIEKLGITSIFVTHDQDEAIEVQMRSSSPIVVALNRRELHWRFTRIRILRLRRDFLGRLP